MNKSEVAWFFLSMRKNSYLRFLPDFLLTLLETHPSQMLLTVHQSTLTITGNSKVKTSLRLIFYFLFGLEREKLYWETLIISGNSSPNFCSWLKKYKSARLANLDNQLTIHELFLVPHSQKNEECGSKIKLNSGTIFYQLFILLQNVNKDILFGMQLEILDIKDWRKSSSSFIFVKHDNIQVQKLKSFRKSQASFDARVYFTARARPRLWVKR